MSSVLISAASGTADTNRAAMVDLPAPLRPFRASTAGRSVRRQPSRRSSSCGSICDHRVICGSAVAGASRHGCTTKSLVDALLRGYLWSRQWYW